MKYCIKCNSPLNDNDRFCPICGAEQLVPGTVYNQFCSACGTHLNYNSQVCGKCGKPVSNMQTQELFEQKTPSLIMKLSERITISAILWLCYASFQLLLAFICICTALVTANWEGIYIIAIFKYGSIGGLNLFYAIKDLKYSKQILTDYVGILFKNRIHFSSILLYIWNGYVAINVLFLDSDFLLMISLVGISAMIVDVIFIRFFIMKNKDSFIEIEIAYNNKMQ